MKKPKYLTKSRFKIARECVTKLHYSFDKNYANSNDGNDFLKALAEGGFQVGELAKWYYPGGHDVKVLDKDKALEITNKLLSENENVIIYEAAIKHDDLYIRADILVKTGNAVDLIEVKAKSADSAVDTLVMEKKASRKKDAPLIEVLNGNLEDYIYDIAFQSYVVENAFPEWSVSPYLMLADKAKKASVNGLNQMFLLSEVNGRSTVQVKDGMKREDLGEQVLGLFDARPAVDLIMSGRDQGIHSREELEMPSFAEEIHSYAKAYASDEIQFKEVDRKCKGCEFRCDQEGLKNGFNECWGEALGMDPDKFGKEENIFSIWNLHYLTSEKLIEQGKIFLKDLEQDDIEQGNPGKSKDRQWIQVFNMNSEEPTQHLDVAGLRRSIASFKFPLHFIDFETSMVAIPFFEGQRPYEQVAFQFSHHMLHEDGTVEHSGEFISEKPGTFPNFEFVRALKSELEHDEGTIFKFAPHENTVLCQIYFQLEESDEEDREELMSWIRTVTKHKKGGVEWEGHRNMVDMCEMVKEHYWDSYMKGSNSIKVVLPAVLNSSRYIQNKYQFPIYGEEIKSLNFKRQQWVEFEGSEVINPYKKLPQVFHDLDKNSVELITRADALKDGGAAMTAYARMQFCEMSDEERMALKRALLRYCELDTMAMVMIMEAWMDWCGFDECLKKVG